MTERLVEDRFLYQGIGRWLDIVTAHVVPEPRDLPCQCAAPGNQLELDSMVERILCAAEQRDAAGVRGIRLRVRPSARCVLARAALRVIRPLGFVVASADVDLTPGVRLRMVHRHVVLFSTARECGCVERDSLRTWIRSLSGASPRGHLLVLLNDGPARESGWRAPNEWRRHCFQTAAAARRSIRMGALQEAEAVLQSCWTEGLVCGWPIPAFLLARRGEVRFWQGRFAEAAAALTHAPNVEPAVRFWRELARWAMGTATLPTPERAGRSGARYLMAPIAVEGRLSSGDAGGAQHALAARRPGRRISPLESALLSRLERRCRSGNDWPPAEADPFVGRSGAIGIQRWGIGRNAMHLLHGISTLLDLVQDADDEHTALRRGCSWVRDQASAFAAGIIANDGTRVLAGDGLGAAELNHPDVRGSLGAPAGRTVVDGTHALIATPVRYGGATIGLALVRGRAEAVDDLREAAKALASVCAPALRARLDALALSAASRTLLPDILGRSPAVTALRETAARAATTAFPVLVEGESGTGKELVARAVHRLSPRRDRRFGAINCAALTDELVEAELFGYVRGAFTGALHTRPGLFEESQGSTLFLDEVAELSPRAQAKLLRVLQEREIRRVGEHLPRPVDVRVVAATNRPLTRAVAEGGFREDLLFRLAVVRIRVPPLRERIEDVPLLSQAFWRSVTEETGKRTVLGADAVAALCRYHWPGNVRELQNVIAALVVSAPTRGRVGARQVDQVLAGGRGAGLGDAHATLERAREALDRRMIAAALARNSGRCASAARELGLSRQGLAKAMRRLGLAPEQAAPSASLTRDNRVAASALVS